MKTKIILAFLLTFILLSCSSNDYKFYQSTTAVLCVYNFNTNELDKYNVAVDVYAKKGDYDHYKIKNSDGVEYFASRAMMYPSEFSTWDGGAPCRVDNFRQGNLVGTLYLPF